MKKPYIYPFLFIISYIFARIAKGVGQIDTSQAIRPALIGIAITAIGLLVLKSILKDGHRASFLFFLFTILITIPIYNFLSFVIGERNTLISYFCVILVLGLFTIGSSQRLWKLIFKHGLITYYLNIVLTIMLVLQAATYAWGAYNLAIRIAGPKDVLENASPVILSGNLKPDIYIIVLDAYARVDVLDQIYQYDNQPFLAELEKRGFYIANQAQSNYVQTPLALGSLLNFRYMPAWDPSQVPYDYLHIPIAKNQVFFLLKENGYKTVAFDTGFSFSDIPGTDIFYSKFLPVTEFESLLLADTSLETLLDLFQLKVPIRTYKTHRERISFTFETLKTVPETVQGPKIVFAHIVSPHPPFIFDESGNFIQPDRPYEAWDGDNFQGDVMDYWEGYSAQLTYINQQALDTIDAILRHSSSPPVIILMSDHGPGSMFRWDYKTPGCLWERTGNLNALLLPGHTKDRALYPTLSPVNNFRLIFNLYFDADIPLLEDKSFLTDWSNPEIMLDITSRARSTQSCTQINP